MPGRFNQIFWGLIFVLVDVDVSGSFDLLPDFIGYALVAVGAGGLTSESGAFGVAAAWSGAMALVSLLQWFVRDDVSRILVALELLGGCALMWALLGGVMVYTTRHLRPDLARRAGIRRQLYVLSSAVTALIGYVGIDADVTPLAFGAVVFVLVISIMILHLIRRVRREVAMSVGDELEEIFD